jgi:type II secretion system protein G
MCKKKNSQKGFTLIELLVVISVIGVLTSIVTANIVGVRERARDAERKSEMAQVQTALEFYRADVGSYPATATYNGISCNAALANAGITYIQNMPCDPPTNTTKYTYSLSGSAYTLRVCLENENDSQKDTTNSGCGAGTWSYTVESP